MANKTNKTAVKYILWYLRMFDSVPSEESISVHLEVRRMKSPIKSAKSTLASLQRAGILTAVGKHSGRHHLTERGFEWRLS